MKKFIFIVYCIVSLSCNSIVPQTDASDDFSSETETLSEGKIIYAFLSSHKFKIALCAACLGTPFVAPFLIDLFSSNSDLSDNFRSTMKDAYKNDDKEYIKYLEGQIDQLDTMTKYQLDERRVKGLLEVAYNHPCAAIQAVGVERFISLIKDYYRFKRKMIKKYNKKMNN